MKKKKQKIVFFDVVFQTPCSLGFGHSYVKLRNFVEIRSSITARYRVVMIQTANVETLKHKKKNGFNTNIEAIIFRPHSNGYSIPYPINFIKKLINSSIKLINFLSYCFQRTHLSNCIGSSALAHVLLKEKPRRLNRKMNALKSTYFKWANYS